MTITRFLKTATGFSLTEVIVALIITSVIIGLALPKYFVTIENSRAREGLNILQAIHNSQQVYKFENGAYTSSITNLDVTIPSSKYFSTAVLNSNNPIAKISRSDGSYTLTITDTGTLSCLPATSNVCKSLIR